MPRNTPAGGYRSRGPCDATCAPRTPRCRAALAAAALAGLLGAVPAAAQETPYAATSRGARCDLEVDGTLTCRYRVGRDLDFTLRRVAEPDVRLEIARSDRAGDYFIEPGLVSGCVLVRYGERSMAIAGSNYVFAVVSGKNGLVYRSLRECRLSR